jgi:hypothetical protein
MTATTWRQPAARPHSKRKSAAAVHSSAPLLLAAALLLLLLLLLPLPPGAEAKPKKKTRRHQHLQGSSGSSGAVAKQGLSKPPQLPEIGAVRETRLFSEPFSKLKRSDSSKQACDNTHRKLVEIKRRFSTGGWPHAAGGQQRGSCGLRARVALRDGRGRAGEETALTPVCILKVIILPRQTRDKHRERDSKKSALVFLQSAHVQAATAYLQGGGAEIVLLCAIIMRENDHSTKTGSGQYRENHLKTGVSRRWHTVRAPLSRTFCTPLVMPGRCYIVVIIA